MHECYQNCCIHVLCTESVAAYFTGSVTAFMHAIFCKIPAEGMLPAALKMYIISYTKSTAACMLLAVLRMLLHACYLLLQCHR